MDKLTKDATGIITTLLEQIESGENIEDNAEVLKQLENFVNEHLDMVLVGVEIRIGVSKISAEIRVNAKAMKIAEENWGIPAKTVEHLANKHFEGPVQALSIEFAELIKKHTGAEYREEKGETSDVSKN